MQTLMRNTAKCQVILALSYLSVWLALFLATEVHIQIAGQRQCWLFPGSKLASHPALLPTQFGSECKVTISSLVDGPHSLWHLDSSSFIPEMHYTELAEKDILFVPQGWVSVIKASGGMMNYSVRKSFYFDTPAGAKELNAMVQLMLDSGRSTDTVAKVQNLLKSHSPAAAPATPAGSVMRRASTSSIEASPSSAAASPLQDSPSAASAGATRDRHEAEQQSLERMSSSVAPGASAKPASAAA